MSEKQLRQLLEQLYELCGSVDGDPDAAWAAPQTMVGIVRRTLSEEPAATWARRWRNGLPIGADIPADARP